MSIAVHTRTFHPFSWFRKTRMAPSWRQWLVVAAVVSVLAAIGFWLWRLSTHSAIVATTSTQRVRAAELITKDLVHMPGSELQDDGLHVIPANFRIVNQDGSDGQVNPPVNLYGGHVTTSGDVTIKAHVKNIGADGSLSFYGKVPIIYDEFRYERSTLQLTFSADRLYVSTWRNDQQTSTSATFTLPDSSADKQIEITRSKGDLHFAINGKQLGTIREDGLFSSGEIWFGAAAKTHPWQLASLRFEQGKRSTLKLVNTTSLAVPDGDGLNTLAKAKKAGFTMGTAVALAPLVSDSQYAAVALSDNFGSFTTENVLKWQFVHPTPDYYAFQEADALVALAQKHHIAIRGHALVFGEANPSWVQNLPFGSDSDKQHVSEVMQQHIQTVVGHFKGKVASWDVVNEPLSDYDAFDAGQPLRQHIWYKALGEAYIAQAFTTAHQADSSAKLYINEFGLEDEGERWDYFLQLVTRLKQAGVPIDGVGFQAHVYERSDRINPDVLKKHMQQLADIGLSSHISEMDVYNDDGPTIQSEQYATGLRACLEAASCDSFTTWGITNRYDMFRDSPTSAPQYGEDYLWDNNLQPTPTVGVFRDILY